MKHPANFRDDAVFILSEMDRDEAFDGSGWTDDQLETAMNHRGYYWVQPDDVWCKHGTRKVFDARSGASIYYDARDEWAEKRRRREAKMLCRWNEAVQGWKAASP